MRRGGRTRPAPRGRGRKMARGGIARGGRPSPRGRGRQMARGGRPSPRGRGRQMASGGMGRGRHIHHTSPWQGNFGDLSIPDHQHSMATSGRHGRNTTGSHMHTSGVAQSHYHRMGPGAHTSQHSPNTHPHNINPDSEMVGASTVHIPPHQHYGVSPMEGPPSGRHFHSAQQQQPRRRGGRVRPSPRGMQRGGRSSQARRTHPHRFSAQTQLDNQHWQRNPGPLNQNLMGYRHHHGNGPAPPPRLPNAPYRRGGGVNRKFQGGGSANGGCQAGYTKAADNSCIPG